MQINNKLRQALKAFRRQFPQGTKLLSVKCNPVGRKYECFANALKYGGRQIFGWQFIVCSGIIIADHHAITEIDGELVCVTADPSILENRLWNRGILMDGDKKIFLRDDTATVIVPEGYNIAVARPQKTLIIGSDRRQQLLLDIIAMETTETYLVAPYDKPLC